MKFGIWVRKIPKSEDKLPYVPVYLSVCKEQLDSKLMDFHEIWYVVGSKSFRPDIQKPRQMENAVRDI